MTYEAMDTCAAMVLADAIEDMAEKTGRPINEIRKELIESPAYDCLLDFESGLWGTGSDYFIEYYKRASRGNCVGR